MSKMIWTLDEVERAAALVKEYGNAGDAAAEIGIKTGTLREALRIHGKPVSELLEIAKLEDLDRLKEAHAKHVRRDNEKKLKKLKTFVKAQNLRVFERNDGVKVYVVVGDVHVPYQDQRACDAVGALMADLRPDGLVVNGDYLDLLEVSRHSSASVAQLEGLRISKSFDGGNLQLDRWLKAAPSLKDNHFVDGNHEDRLRRWMTTGDNAVWLGDESTDIGKRLRFAERGFVYHAGYPKASVKLGHLLVTHGRWCNKYAAATHLDRYGHAILVNHVHSPQMHYGSALDKQKAAWVNGHLADIDSPAMSYAPAPNPWCLGFSVVYVEPNKTFHVTPVQFADGAFYFGGRRYGKGGRS